MIKGESSGSAASNKMRALRVFALVSALAFAGCSAGKTNGGSAEERRELFPSKAGALAPNEPAEARILIDCKRYPNAWQSAINVGDDKDPRRVGETLILGTYDETALNPGGKAVATSGIRVVYNGNHDYLVEPLDGTTGSPSGQVISSADQGAVVTFAFGGAKYTVESTATPMPNASKIIGIMATIACSSTGTPS